MSLKININTNKENKTFEKVKFMPLKAGSPVRARLLQTEIEDVYKHFIPGRNISIVCPGDGCPICLRNRRLQKENPGVNYTQIRGFLPRQHRFLVNVLNRTPVKKDSSGNVIFRNENGQFPPISPTGEVIAKYPEVPLDEVQVLERGATLFNQIVELDSTILDGDPVYKTDSEGNLVVENGLPVIEKESQPLGVTNFDLIFRTSGSRQDTVISVEPRVDLNDEINPEDYKLFDLTTLGLRFTPEEIEKVIAGVGVKDIFEARKATSTIDTGETSDEAEERVSSLFDDVDEDDEF